MRWNIPCAGCGLSVQVGDGQIGRSLRCPSCESRVTVATPPREAPPAQAVSRRPLRWLVGGTAALLAVGVVLGVAYAKWSSGPTASFASPSEIAMMPMRMGMNAAEPRRGGMNGEAGGPGIDAGVMMIGDANHSVSKWLPSDDVPGVNPLASAGKIPTHLAMVLDPSSGRALVATRDGMLRVHDAATWAQVAARRLDQPAYLLQIDPARRLIYAASTPAAALRVSDLGDRIQAGGDVHVYDLDAVLSGGAEPLSPTRRFEVGANLAGLALSPDGRRLYFLAEGIVACRLGRIDTSAWSLDEPLSLRGTRSSLLAMVPDGKRLFVMSGGNLYAIDAQSMRVTEQVAVSIAVQAMLADGRGRLYLAERARGVMIKVIEVATWRQVARWQAETDGTPSLALSPDENRLYVGASAFLAGRVWALDLTGAMEKPVLIGQAGSERGRLLRGVLSVTSDGRHLMTSTGQVFRLPS